MPVRIVSTGGGGVTLSAASTGSEFTATLPANTGTVVTTASSAAVTPAMLTQPLTLATAQASTSGANIDFTGIPSWVRRLTVMFSGVSTNGTSVVQVQLGTSGGVVTTGYAAAGGSSSTGAAPTVLQPTTGFPVVADGNAAYARQGIVVLINVSGNTWVASGAGGESSGGRWWTTGGSISLGGTLDRIRITTVGGTDTFDAGSINILYEG